MYTLLRGINWYNALENNLAIPSKPEKYLSYNSATPLLARQKVQNHFFKLQIWIH